jgi:FtsP/CotA-like multicopper oxidase with cupredoxin domain
MNTTETETRSFSTDPTGLPAAEASQIVELADGDTYELRIAPIANRVGDDTVRMLAYNGSVPGPTLRVRQGSEIAVRVRNDGDHETTVHWHGLRLANEYDGVPFETQAPIPVGGEFTYRLRFPDDGLYWYHPHVREDYGLEMGLYGTILVDPADAIAWPPVNHELIATLDDLLIEDGHIASFSTDGPTHTAMGRFGNVMLTSGKTDLRLDVRTGDVVRFLVVNTANTRIFNISVPGAQMKLVGGDSGRYERETFVDDVLLAPSERAVIDVLFTSPGAFTIEHNTPTHSYRLGAVTVANKATETSYVESFEVLRDNVELEGERARLSAELARPADKTLVLESEMPLLYGTPAETAAVWACPMHAEIRSTDAGSCPLCGMKLVPAGTEAWSCPMHPDVVRAESGTCPKCGMKLVPASRAPDIGGHHASGGHDAHHYDSGDGLEWEDLMPEINAQTDDTNMIGKFVEQDTGKVNHDIDWTFRVGNRVKLRLVNTMDSDHPMHHPFHIHGAGRFLVIARDDVAEPNLVWKDTILVRAGETVDIVVDVTSPGLWMAHCHIAEHNQNGMMFSFRVDPAVQ